MSFAIEIVIKAPMDVVCDYIIEDEKIKEWNTYIIENRYPSNMDKENPRVGDTYITVQKVGKKIVIAEYPCFISLPSEIICGASYSRISTSASNILLLFKKSVRK
ncbi:hypothetical protein ACT4UT_30470, partial [Bacillus sp. B-TM1]